LKLGEVNVKKEEHIIDSFLIIIYFLQT